MHLRSADLSPSVSDALYIHPHSWHFVMFSFVSVIHCLLPVDAGYPQTASIATFQQHIP
jgi:hypothetical protein